MKNVIRNGLVALLMLGLGSLPAVAKAKDKCWILESDDGNGTVSAGELRLRVMSSSGKTDYLLNGTRVEDVGPGVTQSFPVTGGAVKMGSSAQVTLTETGTSDGSSWVTHWHLDLDAETLDGFANAISAATDVPGGPVSSSAAVYAAISVECSDDDDSSDDDSDDDDGSSDDGNSDDDSGDDDSSDNSGDDA